MPVTIQQEKSGIYITSKENTLILKDSHSFDDPNNVQVVTFQNSNFIQAVFEILEQQYGAMLLDEKGTYHLTIRQAFHLISDELAYLTREQDPLWDWLNDWMSQPTLAKSVETLSNPEFNQRLKKALLFLERSHKRDIKQAPIEKSGLPIGSNAQEDCPYDLSGLQKILQRERFEYIYKHRPTIQEIKKDLQITASAWREYVRSTLNPNLTDCSIRHHDETRRWEVVPVNI